MSFWICGAKTPEAGFVGRCSFEAAEVLQGEDFIISGPCAPACLELTQPCGVHGDLEYEEHG